MFPLHDSHHPRLSRRTAIQAGAIGLLSLGMNHTSALRAADQVSTRPGAGADLHAHDYRLLADSPASKRGLGLREFEKIPQR